MATDEPTLYDIVRYLDRRLARAHLARAQGYADGTAAEVGALDTAIRALYPFTKDEHENPYGTQE